MNKIKAYASAVGFAALTALLGAWGEYGAEFIPDTHPALKLVAPLLIGGAVRSLLPLVSAEARRAQAEAEALAGVTAEDSPESAEGP